MSSIFSSGVRHARVLAALLATATFAACSQDQPTGPSAAIPADASAQIAPVPGPSCYPRCGILGTLA